MKSDAEKVDWAVKDVMVGSLGSERQLEDNLKRNYYYAPARVVSDSHFPIRYIALYQSKNLFDDAAAGISYYGAVEYMKRVKRSDIHFPMRKNNGTEDYYAFRVKEWQQLPKKIEIKDEYVNEPKFTNLFLLQNCSLSYELFNVTSQDEFNLLCLIKTAINEYQTNQFCDFAMTYQINDTHLMTASKDCIAVKRDGEIIDGFSYAAFTQFPQTTFNRIKKSLKQKF